MTWVGVPAEQRSGLGVFFYSTFFTSVWLWLFALSQLLIRFLSKVEPLRKFFFGYLLPVEERPFRSIGIVAAVIAMVGYWVFVAIGHAAS